MEGRADLHIHTTYSDGALSAREIILRAREAGLSAISITDHDHTGALDEAILLGSELGVDVIPGVELSVTVRDQDVHILGYFFDHHNPRLLDYLAHFRTERIKRARRIVEKLNDLNLPLPFDAVLDRAGHGSVGRPHIANALVETGLTESYYEAFLKYIGSGKPAYEKKFQISPREAIELVAYAGGLSFIAHPGNCISDELLFELLNEGIDGIEVVHPSHTPDRILYYRGIASEYFLLTSGGSDFHGGRKNGLDVLGKYSVPEDHVTMMRRRLR
ncbi:MAG: PHP domain-containing protein [Bacteroidetes bacterium]|nr:PHP domain-containing protein [Bacteroidota bacterium]